MYLKNNKTTPIRNGVPLDQLLKRAPLTYHAVRHLAENSIPVDDQVARQVEIEIKYEGYIEKQLREIEKYKNLEGITIPETFDFQTVHGLSNELKEKLSKIRPLSLGQASRIDGITPAAISVLMISLKAIEKRQ